MNLESIVKNTGNSLRTIGNKEKEYAPLWVPSLAGAGLLTALYYGASYLLPAFFMLSFIGLATYAFARSFKHYYYSYKYRK